jgi:regulator of protease activity HflC (stomatin/prohibitin superfamily)
MSIPADSIETGKKVDRQLPIAERQAKAARLAANAANAAEISQLQVRSYANLKPANNNRLVVNSVHTFLGANNPFIASGQSQAKGW